jgi:Rrf2 family protein
MFQISSKTDFGLLIMMELAANPGETVSLSSLAKRLGVSSSYLSQIASAFSSADLVNSREGAGGGYYLSRPAEQITVWQILEALSGETKVRCIDHKDVCCPNFKSCGLRSAWPVLLTDIKQTLTQRSLASLLK